MLGLFDVMSGIYLASNYPASACNPSIAVKVCYTQRKRNLQFSGWWVQVKSLHQVGFEAKNGVCKPHHRLDRFISLRFHFIRRNFITHFIHNPTSAFDPLLPLACYNWSQVWQSQVTDYRYKVCQHVWHQKTVQLSTYNHLPKASTVNLFLITTSEDLYAEVV